MTIYAIFPFIASFVSLFLSVFILSKNRKSYTNQTFALWNFSIAFWNYGIAMMYRAATPEDAFFWVRFLIVGLVFIPPTFYHFVLAFTNDKSKARRILCYLGYGFAFFFLTLNRGTYFAVGMQHSYFGYHPIVGIASHLFNVMYVVLVAFSFYVLFSAYRQNSGLRRRQIKYVFWAAAIGFGGGVTNFLTLYGIKMYPISNLCIIFFSAIIAYAILKHRLMDIEVVIKKSIVYSILVGAAMGSYVLLTLLFGQFLHGLTHNGTLMIMFLTAVVIIVGYEPLERLLENATDKVFFKRKYNYRKALKDFSAELRMMINLEQLLNLIVVNIAKILKINRVSLLLKKDGFWSGIKYEYSSQKDQLSEIRVKLEKDFSQWVLKSELFVRDEIENEAMIKELDKLKACLCLPLIIKGKTIGILNLGKKLSEEHYNNEDLELLITFANHLSIALENARLVQREKEMLNKLQQAEKLASLGRFASGLIHEIRNPLVSIKAFFQIFAEQGSTSEDKQELSELASQEIVRVEGLLDNLLNFSKPSSPEFSYEDVYDILIETVQLIKPELSSKKITLFIEKNIENLPKVHIDHKQIKQVFMNFIYNAIDAMPDGGELRIKFYYNPEKGSLIIEFKDNGCGIDKNDFEKLFDPFYSTKSEGVGMGLAVSYNIIKNHHGDIVVLSDIDKGSTFKISLPVNQLAQ